MLGLAKWILKLNELSQGFFLYMDKIQNFFLKVSIFAKLDQF